MMFKIKGYFRIQRYKIHKNQLSKPKKHVAFLQSSVICEISQRMQFTFFSVLVLTQISYLHQNNCVLSKEMEFAQSDIFQYFLNAAFHALFDEVEMSETVNKELYMCGN